MKFIFFFIGILFFVPTQGQMDAWLDFQNQAAAIGMQLAIPVEQQFKKVRGFSTLYPCDFAVSKRRGDLEIRMVLIPSGEVSIPHIETMGLITSLATNEQETVVSLLPIEAKVLEDEYAADWGVQAFFKPKSSFSDKTHCRLLALYKEEKAMAYLIYLFDKPSEDLEQQRYLLRFEKED